MQFEQPQTAYSTPFGYPQGAYHAFSSPPPAMHRHFEPTGYPDLPTPVPSPRTPSSRRRSNTAAPQEFMGGPDYMAAKRPSSSRRPPSGAPPAEGYTEFEQQQQQQQQQHASPHHHYPHRSATSPRPGTSHGRPQPGFLHTPLQTPSPSSHAHHMHGAPMPPHGTPMPGPYYHPYGFTSPPPSAGEHVSPPYVPPPSSDYGRYVERQRSAESHRHQQPWFWPNHHHRHPDRSPYHYSVPRTPPSYDYPPPPPPPPPYHYRYPPRWSPADGQARTPQFMPPAHPGAQSPPPPYDGRRSRAHRREATWSGDNSPRSPPRTGSTKPPPPPTRAATDPTGTASAPDQAELRRKAQEAGIPSDYSLKNWDPNERPIILLGSVFDAGSLGEWVFNWTKYHHGRQHEATRTAGGLWELLIELSSKLKRADEFFDSIRSPENKETVSEFIESGERLWAKLKSLLKSCEEYMWSGARRVNSPGGGRPERQTKVQMGKQSGAEFVDAMFNGSKEWEKTERLMRGMATWCHRFQINCEEILKKADA